MNETYCLAKCCRISSHSSDFQDTGKTLFNKSWSSLTSSDPRAGDARLDDSRGMRLILASATKNFVLRTFCCSQYMIQNMLKQFRLLILNILTELLCTLRSNRLLNVCRVKQVCSFVTHVIGHLKLAGCNILCWLPTSDVTNIFVIIVGVTRSGQVCSWYSLTCNEYVQNNLKISMIWAVQTEHMGDAVVLPRLGSKALAWKFKCYEGQDQSWNAPNYRIIEAIFVATFARRSLGEWSQCWQRSQSHQLTKLLWWWERRIESNNHLEKQRDSKKKDFCNIYDSSSDTLEIACSFHLSIPY